MSSEAFSKIKLELSQLNRLITTYQPLLCQLKTREPTDIEIVALAGILHSFYSGFENIFKRIAQDIDGSFTKTDSWHMDLLESMVVPTKNRSAVISQALKRRLQFYLGFRHAFRSAYSYDLMWPKMKTLVFDSEEILHIVETELTRFIHSDCR